MILDPDVAVEYIFSPQKCTLFRPILFDTHAPHVYYLVQYCLTPMPQMYIISSNIV